MLLLEGQPLPELLNEDKSHSIAMRIRQSSTAAAP